MNDNTPGSTYCNLVIFYDMHGEVCLLLSRSSTGTLLQSSFQKQGVHNLGSMVINPSNQASCLAVVRSYWNNSAMYFV